LIAAAVLMLIALTPAYGRAQATVRLRQTVSPAARSIPNAIAAPAAMPMEISVVLALRNTAELEQLQRDQQDPSSPRYHRWLTAAQFNERFGPRQADADAVAQWLTSAGFTIKSVDRAQRLIKAAASAAVVEHALETTIVTNGSVYANRDEPAVPAALASVIATIEGLNNTFAVVPMAPRNLRLGPALPDSAEPGAAVAPEFRTTLGLGFSPADFRTYYNESALISGGIAGTKAPDCIALAAVSDVHASSFGAFTNKFHLPAVKLTKIFASGGTPGFNGGEIEADLDVEYAHVLAPNTPIRLYIGRGASDLRDALGRAVSDNVCGAISISFSFCGEPDTFFSVTLDQIFAQASAQGQSVFASSGDDGAAGVVFDGISGCVTGSSLNVSEMCADPNGTCVGGTQFDPNYDSQSRDTSTVHDGLDSAWNESGIGATGGGVSTIFSRPAWQAGSGMRLVPDVSLGAALNSPGYYIVGFTSGSNRLALIGGTSLSSPAWAGYSRLIAQAFGNGRLGLMNPHLYDLGNMGSGSGLIDVIAGNNSFNGVSGFAAAVGYDLATGWGSPDMSTLLISYLAGGTAAVTPASVSAPPKAVIADAGVLTLTNSASSALMVDSVAVSLSRASVFKAVSLSSGAQTVTPLKSKKMVFLFNPPISIGVGGMADFTLSATMAGVAQAGTPQSVQSLSALGVSATAAGSGVTFIGLPASLGSVRLTH
jgi:subtilase family serine protease